MGHHINAAGQFQSDKHPELPPDKIIVSFNDPHARRALRTLARDYGEADLELSVDILTRLNQLDREGDQTKDSRPSARDGVSRPPAPELAKEAGQ